MVSRTDTTILAFAAATYAVLWAAFYPSGRIQGTSQHLGMGCVLAATLGMLGWNLGAHCSYHAWRPWSVAAYQLASATVITLAGLRLQLQETPMPGLRGALVDALRVLTGGHPAGWWRRQRAA